MDTQYRVDLQSTGNPYSNPQGFAYPVRALLFNRNDKFYHILDFAVPCRTEFEASKYIEENKEDLIHWIDCYSMSVFSGLFTNKRIIIES